MSKATSVEFTLVPGSRWVYHWRVNEWHTSYHYIWTGKHFRVFYHPNEIRDIPDTDNEHYFEKIMRKSLVNVGFVKPNNIVGLLRRWKHNA